MENLRERETVNPQKIFVVLTTLPTRSFQVGRGEGLVRAVAPAGRGQRGGVAGPGQGIHDHGGRGRGRAALLEVCGVMYLFLIPCASGNRKTKIPRVCTVVMNGQPSKRSLHFPSKNCGGI